MCQLTPLRNSGQILRPTSQCQKLSPEVVSKQHLVTLARKWCVEDIMSESDPTTGLKTITLGDLKDMHLYGMFRVDTIIAVVVSQSLV